MKLFDNNPFHLVGQMGEEITVTVESNGTAHMVVYALNGQGGTLSQGRPLVFLLIRHPTVLDLSLSFSNPQGGAYQIRVTGSGEGDESDYTLKQSPNPGMSANLEYLFSVGLLAGVGDLGGDETKDDYE